MSEDRLIDLLRRRTSASWIDVLLSFIVGVIVSIAFGQAHVGSWTTNDPSPIRECSSAAFETV